MLLSEQLKAFVSRLYVFAKGSILNRIKADIVAASLLISHFTFSSLISSWIATIISYILSNRFFLKSEELSDATVVLITKKESGFAVHYL